MFGNIRERVAWRGERKTRHKEDMEWSEERAGAHANKEEVFTL